MLLNTIVLTQEAVTGKKIRFGGCRREMEDKINIKVT